MAYGHASSLNEGAKGRGAIHSFPQHVHASQTQTFYLTTGTVGSACRDAVQTRPLFLLEIIYAVQKT